MAQCCSKYCNLLSIGLLPLIIIHLITAYQTLPPIVRLKLHQDCEEITSASDCECSLEQQGYSIACPRQVPEPKILVHVHQNKVKIECQHLDPSEFGLLPKISNGIKNIVEIKSCPLPREKPIQSILQKLEITQVKELLFSGDQHATYVTRQHFNGLQNISHLSLMSNGILVMPVDVFADLKYLTRLNLRWNQIKLKKNLFTSLKKLTILELDGNNLESLPIGIFRNQQKLISLNLWNNRLTNLTKESFEGVSSLTDLDLSANSIITFHSDVFSPIKNLRNININRNIFETLPSGLFTENKNLSQFYLNNTRVPLKYLPATLLSNLPVLRMVDLSCGLEAIPPDVFANSTAIRNITISKNHLTKLPRILFADQYKLINLDLTKNALKTLPNDIFQNTSNLIVLQLSHNNLRQLSSTIFNSLVNLEILLLDNNNLFSVSDTAFTHTRKLTCINMENNRISMNGDQLKTSYPFKDLRELEVLILRNNSIDNRFRHWTWTNLKLHTLDLSYNRVSIVNSYDLWSKNSHISINLTYNNIQTINFDNIDNTGTGSSNESIRVAIEHNPLNCDYKLLSFVRFLNGDVGKHLNGILKFTVDKLACSAPEILKDRLISSLFPDELSSKPFDVCPRDCQCVVQPTAALLYVNCSSQGLTKIPHLPVAWDLSATALFVEHNKLSKLPVATTSGYDNVTKLYAANNILNEISVNNLPKNLSHLDLSHNNLTTLNDGVLKVLNESPYLEILALSHNPWLCDCSSLNLLGFIQSKYKNIKDLTDIQCVSGKRFIDLSSDAICPDWIIIAAVIVGVLGLSLGILAGLYYKYQQEIKVWLYAHNLCLWLVTEDDLDKDKKYDAFISYSHKDEEFIADYLQPGLENGPAPFKLCLHDRDWVVGELIENQILRSVHDSRRTIVLLSPNFIESVWAPMEFRAAHTAALNEGRARVIVIIYGEIGSFENLDTELKAYIQMNTYVEWGDTWFWQKLRYAMPHRSAKQLGIASQRV